ncbi:MAG: hypothetical protein RMM29_06570 [Planctomycetota bacterium]|nr:hypothetical protein [Planctomycetota bacterium]MCX8040532.1 hypothetical protein [Planctomycetota bacterium]MDW8373293.1 hypothetical protein [Planctomycetota bacterium]
MTATLAPATARLVAYLTRIGGVDTFECCDDHGDPDPLAARRLAETLRARHAADLGTAILVTQHAHRVTLRLVEPALARR